MKKKLFLILVVAIAMVSVSAMAQGEDVLVNSRTWDPATIVYSDQNIVLAAGWGACRRGAVQSFLTATNTEWSLVGGTLNLSGEDTNNYWGRPYSYPAPDPDPDFYAVCMGRPSEVAWRADWRYPIGQLPAGVYTLTTHLWIDHPVTDVADYDGDGHPDLFKDISLEYETTIQVDDR